MNAPLYSTLTLFTEMLISVAIVFIFYSGYKKNKFPYRIAVFAIVYEIFFNISYMVYRTISHNEPSLVESAFEIMLAIFHGTLSLIMFIALIVFLIAAWKNYNKKINYFKKHKILTITFLIFWFLAVISGILLYFIEYL